MSTLVGFVGKPMRLKRFWANCPKIFFAHFHDNSIFPSSFKEKFKKTPAEMAIVSRGVTSS